MLDNVKPCPNCCGTGEIYTVWYVEDRYQDGMDRFGPFTSEKEAKRHYPPTKSGEPSFGILRVYVESRIGPCKGKTVD